MLDALKQIYASQVRALAARYKPATRKMIHHALWQLRCQIQKTDPEALSMPLGQALDIFLQGLKEDSQCGPQV